MASGWLILDELQIMLVAGAPRRPRRRPGPPWCSRALMQEARQQGASGATLEVAAGNTAALALYGAARIPQHRHAVAVTTAMAQDALIQWLPLVEIDGIAMPALGFSTRMHWLSTKVRIAALR